MATRRKFFEEPGAPAGRSGSPQMGGGGGKRPGSGPGMPPVPPPTQQVPQTSEASPDRIGELLTPGQGASGLVQGSAQERLPGMGTSPMPMVMMQLLRLLGKL